MKKSHLLLLIGLVCYIFIPYFILPVSQSLRLLIFGIYISYFFINYILLQKAGIDRNYNRITPANFSLRHFFQENKLLFVILIVSIIIHIYPITSRTILMGYDEPVTMQSGLGLYTRLSHYTQRFFGQPLVIICLVLYSIILLLFILFRSQIKELLGQFRNLFYDFKSLTFLFPVFIFVLSLLYFIVTKNTNYSGSLFRYPPIEKILYFLSYSVFGIHEFAPRLVQLMMGSISAIFFYRTILLFYNKNTALLCSMILLFNPLFSQQINYAELGIGVVFFGSIILFYLSRFLKEGYNNDLFISYLMIGLGFLYKDEIILYLPIVSTFLLLTRFKYFIINLKKMFLLNWLVIILFLPHWLTTNLFQTAHGWLDIANFSKLFDHRLFDYLIYLKSQVSWVLLILFFVSFLYVVLKERKEIILFVIYIFFCYYIFYTIYDFDPANRFSLNFIPAIAILISVFIAKVFSSRPKIVLILTLVLGIYLSLISNIIILPEVQPQLVVYKNVNLEHYPIDKAMKWLKENNYKENILSLYNPGIAFYRDKYGFQKESIMAYDIDEYAKYNKVSLDSFCKELNINCIVISSWRGYLVADKIDSSYFPMIKTFSYENGNWVKLFFKENLNSLKF